MSSPETPHSAPGDFSDEFNPDGLCNFEDAHGGCDEKATCWVVTRHSDRLAMCDEHKEAWT